MDRGGLLLWVRTRDTDDEKRAVEILKKTFGRRRPRPRATGSELGAANRLGRGQRQTIDTNGREVADMGRLRTRTARPSEHQWPHRRNCRLSRQRT